MLEKSYVSVHLALAMTLCALITWLALPFNQMQELVNEGGVVENLTLAAYGLAVLSMLLLPPRQISMLTRISLIIVFLAMAAREADLHKYLTGMSVLKIKYWLGNTPILDKIYALAVLLPIALSCLNLLLRYRKSLWANIKDQQGYAITILTFFILIVLTNIIDRSLGVAKEWFDWHAPESIVALFGSLEEMLELLLPFLIIVAALQYYFLYVSKRSDVEASPVPAS